MTRKHNDIKIVDVRKSILDEEKSKATGKPIFKTKVFYKYRDNTGLAPYWFYWANINDATTLNWLQVAQNYEFVTKNDPYVPDGVPLNADKKYQYGDLVLMRCPLQEYIQRRIESRRIAEARVKSRKNQFREELAQDGGQSLTEEELANLLGD